MNPRPAPAPQRPPTARPAIAATRRALLGEQDPKPTPAPAPRPAPAAAPKPQPPTPASAADTLLAIGALSAQLAKLGSLLELSMVDITHQLADVERRLTEKIEQHPTAAAAAAPAGNYQDFTAAAIRVGISETNGERTYKAVGHPFTKFGVRVWPEVMPALGIDDPLALKFGDNPFKVPPLVRALMGEQGPKKIIGLAPALPAEDDIPF